MSTSDPNWTDVDAELAAKGMRRAINGENGWYVTITGGLTVWTTDLPAKVNDTPPEAQGAPSTPITDDKWTILKKSHIDDALDVANNLPIGATWTLTEANLICDGLRSAWDLISVLTAEVAALKAERDNLYDELGIPPAVDLSDEALSKLPVFDPDELDQPQPTLATPAPKGVKLTKRQHEVLEFIASREGRGRVTHWAMISKDVKIARKLAQMKLVESKNIDGYVALSLTPQGREALAAAQKGEVK